MNITTMSLTALKKALEAGSVTSLEIIKAYRSSWEADQKTALPLNGYIEFFDDAEEKAEAADALRAKGDTSPLLGLPFAVKDNISVRGKECTCGSRILRGYVAPFNATVTERLIAAGAIPIGRTNMDEFAMGSSTEYSSYGPSRNPVNRELSPGGSSGGSASVVAGGQAPFALGTETGGSVRLPASYCGLYGFKPTYGTLSRYGVVAFGSSLDQVGLFARSADDIALALSVMAGVDPHDGTSADVDLSALANLKPAEIKGLRVAIPAEFLEEKGLDPEVAAVFEEARTWFTSRGAIVETLSIPVLEASIASYYVIALSEASSNLSRFDGIRFGERKDPGEGFDELYVETRSKGFNAEVKRRIIIGNYVASTHFSGDCYKKAMSVRARIQKEITEVFSSYDIILCPTNPTPAFPLGSKVDDPMAMYLTDLFTTFVNLARIPSISVPMGQTKDRQPKGQEGAPGATLPVGVQICGPQFSEERILGLAKAWEVSL